MHSILLVDWGWWIWGVCSIVVFILCLLLIGIILIQDSKDTGLTSAFGGAGGGQALLGARMQKDLAKLTGIFGAILAVCLIAMGITSRFGTGKSIGEVGAQEKSQPPAAARAVDPALPLDPLAPESLTNPAPAIPTDPAPGGPTHPAPGALPGTPGAPRAAAGSATTVPPAPGIPTGTAPGTAPAPAPGTPPATGAESPAPPAASAAPSPPPVEKSSPAGASPSPPAPTEGAPPGGSAEPKTK